MVAPPLWTVAMVRELPDDGYRYECVDGALLVTPAPRPLHELTIARLVRRLVLHLAASHPAMSVHSGESEITWGEERTYLQPDIYVVPESEFFGRWTDVRSLVLAVEVLSPSSIEHDRVTKRPVYQRHRVGTYWVVDIESRTVEVWHPDDERPAIATEVLTWQLDDGAPELRIPLTELFTPPSV